MGKDKLKIFDFKVRDQDLFNYVPSLKICKLHTTHKPVVFVWSPPGCVQRITAGSLIYLRSICLYHNLLIFFLRAPNLHYK